MLDETVMYGYRETVGPFPSELFRFIMSLLSNFDHIAAGSKSEWMVVSWLGQNGRFFMFAYYDAPYPCFLVKMGPNMPQ